MNYKRISTAILLVCFFISGAFAQNTLVKTTDDDLYRKGLELLDKEKYGAAREQFTQYIRLQPASLKAVDAEYYIAYCALGLFNSDGEELINNFIRKYPYHSKTAVAYYDLGNLYYNNKKYDKAIEYLEKTDPKNLSEHQRIEAKFKLGYSYFTKKEFEKATPAFNEVKVTNNKYTYAACYYAGYSELKSGNYTEALSDLTKAEMNEDYKALVPHMITNIYYRQGRYDEVIAYGERALANPATQVTSEISLMVADAYYLKKDYKKALENFNRYLTEDKGTATREIQYRIGFSQYKNDKYEDAVNTFKNIASNTDTLGQSSAFYLGLSYLKTGTKEFALTAFDQARKLDFSKKTKEEALFYYGKVNYDLQRYHDAIAPLKDFVSNYTSSSHYEEANELLSEAFLKTNNYGEAIAYIEGLRIRSTRINAAYQKLTFYRGTELFNNGAYSDAKAMFSKSMLFNYDRDIYISAAYWKAEVYSISKEYEEAINAYAHVFEKTGDDENIYHLKSRYGIGYAYYNTRKYDKALIHFKEYVKQLEKASDKMFYTDALLRLADLYYVDKKYKEAIRYYDLAIKNGTLDVDYAYYQKGVVQVYEDQLAEAKNSFETVIRQYPNSLYYEGAIYQKAQIDFRNNDLNQALLGFSKLIGTKLNNEPYEANALLKRAIIYNNLKKHELALADYNMLLDKYYNQPIHEDALRGAQETYALLDRSEEFTAKLDEFKQKNPESAALDDVGFESAKNLYFEEKYKKAVPAFESYLTRFPQSMNAPDARFYLADSYYQIGDNEKASQQYQVVIEEKKSAYVTKALQRMADINFKAQKYPAARDYYLLFDANSKNKKEKNNAMLGLMETYYALGQYDSTDYYAKEVLKSGGININAESKASMYLGKAAYAKGEYEKATDYFLNLINYNNERLSAEAQYYISEIQYKQKKYKQSIESLYYLNNNFGSDEYWLGKSFLLISENLMALNEEFQAKATLKSIIANSKNKEIVTQAQTRLAEIEAASQRKEGGNNE
ncbi:MAG TPA: tetratricopeptide repeat protein [Cytophagaceae bacterium]|nr:tetratricopeptide repeat protein [Cytophagaceae bacterium]